ncbi:hypothetical protein HDU97_001717 [Phlyctochytrium planicorne]|nr:hypothetical protein HDU97_001717 [Phlyctochytrium planicorne]
MTSEMMSYLLQRHCTPRPDLRPRSWLDEYTPPAKNETDQQLLDDANMALVWACRFGETSLLRVLLGLPRDPITSDPPTTEKHLPLEPSERTSNANLAIALLAEEGHVQALTFVLNRVKIRDLNIDDVETPPIPEKSPYLTVDPSAFEHHALRMSAKNGHLKVLITLAERGMDPGALGNYALRWAALNGHTEVVRYLSSHDLVDPTEPNDCALRWGARNGHAGVVKILLEVGESPTTIPPEKVEWKDDPTESEWNNFMKYMDQKRRSRPLRCNPATDGNDALRWACMEGHDEVVKILLDSNRVDPSAESNEALRWASRNGHLKVVELLLATNKVDPSAEDHEALRWASKCGYADIAKLLLSHGRKGKNPDEVRNDDEGMIDRVMNEIGRDAMMEDNGEMREIKGFKTPMPKHVLLSLQLALQRGHLEVAQVLLNFHK